MKPTKQRSQKSQKIYINLILLQLILLPIIFTPKLLLSRTENKVFTNIRATNFLLGRNLTISENVSIGQNALISGDLTVGDDLLVNGGTTITGNLFVNGTINGGGGGIVSPVLPANTNEVARFVDNTGTKITGSPVTIDNSGNVGNVADIEINSITSNGITKGWPTILGAPGQSVVIDLTGNNLTYGVTPGTGNVSTAAPYFSDDNRIVTTDTPTSNTNIKQTSVSISGNTITGDLSGNVTGTLTGNVTGHASEDVRINGADTMTGDLKIAYPNGLKLLDFGGTNYVGLTSPISVTPYTVKLPASPPTSHQFLQATQTTPTDLVWTTLGGGTPQAAETFYVSKSGSDVPATNRGSFYAPFLTVKAAVDAANLISNAITPVAINVGPGVFDEPNPIQINADYISIVGSAISATMIKPTVAGADLFYSTHSNIALYNFSMIGIPGSTNAVHFLNPANSRIRIEAVTAALFATGFNFSGVSPNELPTIIIWGAQSVGCTTAAIALSNVSAFIENGVFRGPVVGSTPANTGITIEGAGSLAYITNSGFLQFSNCVSITNGAAAEISGSIFNNTTNTIICNGTGSKTKIVGCTFLLNNINSVNINSSDSGSVYLEGCLFDCEDASKDQQGTCIRSTTNAEVIVSNSTLDEANIGIDCGQTNDGPDTSVLASGVNLRDNLTADIQKIGLNNLSTIHFNGGSFDENLVVIGAGNNENTVIGSFDDDGSAAFGNNQDTISIPIYKVSTGQTDSPTLNYYPSFYGSKGTAYLNQNADPTFNATVAQVNDASYYVITGDNTKQAKINLISDASAIGTGDNVRGWEINKLGGAGNLAFTYSSNDGITYGPNNIMQLDGVNNQIILPTTANPVAGPTTPVLVWGASGASTNLYRNAANTLKTDSNLVIGTGRALTVPVGSAAAPSINFGDTASGLYSSGATGTVSFSTAGAPCMNISPTGVVSINNLSPTGVVHNDNSGNLSSSLIDNVDIKPNIIQNDRLATVVTSNPTGNTIVLRDGSGDFSAHAITAVGGTGAGFFATGAGNGFFATGGAFFNGDLHGNATSATSAGSFSGSLGGEVTGPQLTTFVNNIGGIVHSDIVTYLNDAKNATDVNPTGGLIVKRDGSGNFSAGTITAALTGHASQDVLKAGDTMTGILAMGATGARQPINFRDNGLAGNYVGLQAPAAVSASYTVDLPSTAPITGQFLQANSPTTTTWTSIDAPPVTTQTFYVTKAGIDSPNPPNNGSLSFPFASVKKALQQAELIATATSPVVINVGPGLFIEDNSGSTLNITKDGISIIGSSPSGGTIIQPNTPANLLFNATSNNFTMANLEIAGTYASTNAALSLTSTGTGIIIFDSVSVALFQTGFSFSRQALTTSPNVLIENCQFIVNGTGVIANDTEILTVQSSVFSGSEAGPFTSKGISLTGTTHPHIAGCTFIFLDTGVEVNGPGVKLSLFSSILEANTISLSCLGGGLFYASGNNFVKNRENTVNVYVSGSNTQGNIEGCLFNGLSLSNVSTGTALKVTTAAKLYVNNSAINNAGIAIQCGQTGDIASTVLAANSVNLRNCTVDLMQSGTSKLIFSGGSIETPVFNFDNTTNINIAEFSTNGETSLAFGNTSDDLQDIYKIQNGPVDANLPLLHYNPNFYGNKGTLFHNPGTANTFNGTLAGVGPSLSGDASYYVVTGDNTKQAKINLISDISADPGVGTNVRGWEIGKLGNTSADLGFAYSDNDGLPGRGSNKVIQLDGFNNIVNFPLATNAPTPTNTVAQLVWAGDTNLYRNAANTLKTDDNFIIGTGSVLTVPSGSAGAPSINFGDATSGLYSSGATGTVSFSTAGAPSMNISPTGVVSINNLSPTGIVHNDSSGNLSSSLIVNNDITAGIIQNDRLATVVTSSPTGGTIVLRDGSGDFSAHAITAVGGAGAGFFASATGAKFLATGGAIFEGPLTGNATSANTATNFSGNVGPAGDITGVQTNMTVNTVGGVIASQIASGVTAANAATGAYSTNTIVKRDSSGNFTAHAITATGATGGFFATGGAGFFGQLTGNVIGTASNATQANYADAAATFTTALTGDAIGGNAPNLTTVVSIGGGLRTAAQVIAATDLALSATSNDTFGTIVRRDDSGNFITNMISLNTNAIINPNDATTKSYVDTQVVAGGLVPKEPVLVVSTVSTNTFGFDYIDSVTVADGNRVLLIAQSSPSSAVYNGIWEARSGDWTRPTDFANTTTAGRAYVLTTSGNSQAGSSWLCSTPLSVIGTDTIGFVQFGLPGTTTGANVGSGAGQIFKDKVGQTLNFKTLAALTYMKINNQADTVELGPDATPSNATGTIIARDASGYFSATGMTGAASANVLKAGDTMTGPLSMGATGGTKQPIRFRDNGLAGNYVGIQAPASIGSSYTIDLPNTAPVAGQFLQALTSTITTWTTVDAPPTSTKTYYVTLAGYDGSPNDGSLSFPFKTIGRALQEANNFSSVANPINISVGAGIFTEDNTSGAIPISGDSISIIGQSITNTVITPKDPTQNLFYISTQSVEISFLSLCVDSSSSTATALLQTTTNNGYTEFNSVSMIGFNKGIEINNPTAMPIIVFDNIQAMSCGTTISISGAQALIKNCAFQGSSINSPAYDGISITGANTQVVIISSSLLYFENAIKTAFGALLRASAITIDSSINGFVCKSGSNTSIVGLTNTFNYPNSINISADGIDTDVYIEGSLLNCADAATQTIPTGTAIQSTGQAKINISSTTIHNAGVGIACGTSSDTDSTIINANSVNLLNCPIDILQPGAAKISFISGTIENSTVNLTTPSKVNIATFNSDGGTALSFGNTTESEQPILRIQNNPVEANLPNLTYKTNFYGSNGTVYTNPASNPTLNALVSQSNNADYYVITSDSTKKAAINLISDAVAGLGNNMRGWKICKNSNTGADLLFTYTNNDGAAYGPNTIMQLDGVNNKIKFPTATNPPTGTPVLEWAGDTNLYRNAANTLKTDDNFVIGTGSVLTVPAGSAGVPSINFGDTASGLYSSGATGTVSFSTASTPRMNISSAGVVSINNLSPTGVVHNDSSGNLYSSLIVDNDIAIGTIADNKLSTTVINTNTPNTIVKRDGSGDFSAHAITAIGGTGAGFFASGAGNGFFATTGASFNGPLHGLADNATSAVSFSSDLAGEVTGPQGTTFVNNIGGIVHANIVTYLNDAKNATDINPTGGLIVKRDGSGNFSAGTITASLTGHASQDVLKAGDTMTGILNMGATGARQPINFRDNGLAGNYVGIQAPAAVGTSYTIDLPATAPSVGQFLQAVSGTPPYTTQWVSGGGAPSATREMYVSVVGSDGNDGSLGAPYRHVKYAVAQADPIATSTSPVVINVGPGVFVEDVSGSSINITKDGINIIGTSPTGTIIQPSTSTANPLFSTSKSNITFENISFLGATGGSPSSAFSLNSTGTGSINFNAVNITSFATGLSLSKTSGKTLILVDNLQTYSVGKSINANNSIIVIQNSFFYGPLTDSNTPINTAIAITGSQGHMHVSNSRFTLYDTCISADAGANIYNISGCTFENTINSIICTGGSKCTLVGCNFVINNPTSVNIFSSGTNSLVYVESCIFECLDDQPVPVPQGTCLKATLDGAIVANNTTIDQAALGMACGQAGDSIDTFISATDLTFRQCVWDLIQSGQARLRFAGGRFDTSKITISYPTNVKSSSIDDDGALAFGIYSDTTNTLYKITNGQASAPSLIYQPDYYGNKGTVYTNLNTTTGAQTFNATQSNYGDASYYVTTGDSTKTANLNLISDGTPGTWAGIRGWAISKLNNTGADLAFTYTNNDGAAYGPNTIMKLDGVNNQIILPTTTNPVAPLAYTTPMLVWGTGSANTNLYRSAPDTLKTDGNFIIGGVVVGSTLTVPTGSAGSPSISFVNYTDTGIYSSGIRNISFANSGSPSMNISPTGVVSINTLVPTGAPGVVHNDGSGNLFSSLIVNSDISTGTITLDKLANPVTSAPTANSYVLRDGNSSFAANAITVGLGFGATGPGFYASGAGNGFFATNSASFNGPLHGNADTATSATSFSSQLGGDVHGFMSTTTVITVGNKSAADIATAVTTVFAAVPSPATANTLVQRDASGGFTAGTITATLLIGHASQDILKAGDTMLGTFTAIAGFENNPAIQFTGSTNTGFYSTGPSNVSISTNGVAQMNLNPGSVAIPTGILSVPTGAVGAPSMTFNTNTNTGFYSTGANNVSITTNGAAQMNLNPGTVTIPTGILSVPAGAVGAPSINFGSATSGIYSTGAGNVSITTAGVARMYLNASGATLPTAGNTLTLPASAAGTSSLNFSSATGVGISATGSAAASVLSLNTASSTGAGIERMFINATGVTIDSPGTLTLPASAAGTSSLNFSSATGVGISATGSAAASVLSLNTASSTGAGIERMNVSATGVTLPIGVLSVPAGAVGAPSINFGSATSGIYSTGAGNVSITTAGVARMYLNASGATLPTAGNTLTLPASAAGTSSLNFSSATGVGISATGSAAASVLSLNTASSTGAGIERMFVNATGVTIDSPGTLTLPTSASPNTSLNFAGSTGTGLSATGNTLSFETNATEKMSINSAGTITVTTGPLTLPAGIAPANMLNFTGNTTTGLSSTGGVLSLNATGVNVVNVSSTGATITTGNTLTLPATTAPTPSLNFTSNLTTGISATGGALSINAGGIEAINATNALTTILTPLCYNSITEPTNFSATGSVPAPTTSIVSITASGGTNITITITMPSTPVNGELFTVHMKSSTGGGTKTIAYTGGTVVNPITQLNPTANFTATTGGASVTYIYMASTASWYKFARG